MSQAAPQPQSAPEPWLRGPIEGIHPLVMPVFFTFAHVREELPKITDGLDREEVWRSIHGAAPIGFHLKHIAGSVDRLTTYIFGDQLTSEQLDSLRREGEADTDLDELIAAMNASLRASEERLRQVDPERLYEARYVGRKALPTTVIGLIVHLAEHTQRHLGQAVTTAKILRDTG